MSSRKPIASLSLDVDNKWSYLKTHGEPSWASFPSYLDILIPRVLELLKSRGLQITFFIVGQDAAREENRNALRSIADAGHEIGNHSFHHDPWLHLFTEAEIEAEVAAAEESIEQATGQRPIGFRGPGFSLSPATLRVLARRGYQYDASTFPTFLGPLARLYYFLTANFSPDEKRRRRALFGKLSDGLRPLKPYRWEQAEGLVIEIPVTTLPLFRTPVHVSYLLYLSVFSPVAATTYFRAALALCRSTGVQPSLLLHPTDFLDLEDAPELSFFPAMGLSAGRKGELVRRWLDLLADQFTIVPMHQHAREVSCRGLPVLRMSEVPDRAENPRP